MFGPKQLAEVAGAHQRRRNFLLREIIVVVACPLLSNQEEELLAVLVEVTGNIEGAVQVPAELVVVEALPLGARIIASPGVGVQRGVAEVLEGAAVEVARAALGNHADLAAGSAAVLSRIAGGQHLHLRGRVHVGHADAGAVGAGAHHRRAIVGQHALLASARR